MTDTYDSQLLDDGGQWLPTPTTARAEAEARGNTPNEAIDALWTVLAERWPGWRLASDVKVTDEHIDISSAAGPREWVPGLAIATATIVKEIQP